MINTIPSTITTKILTAQIDRLRNVTNLSNNGSGVFVDGGGLTITVDNTVNNQFNVGVGYYSVCGVICKNSTLSTIVVVPEGGVAKKLVARVDLDAKSSTIEVVDASEILNDDDLTVSNSGKFDYTLLTFDYVSGTITNAESVAHIFQKAGDISEIIDDKVSKSGDTLSGELLYNDGVTAGRIPIRSYHTTGFTESMSTINSKMKVGDIKVVYGDLYTLESNYVPFLNIITEMNPPESMLGVCTLTKINSNYIQLDMSIGLNSGKKMTMRGDWDANNSTIIAWSIPLQKVDIPQQILANSVTYTLNTNGIHRDYIYAFETTGVLSLPVGILTSTNRLVRERFNVTPLKFVGSGMDFNSGGGGTLVNFVGWLVPQTNVRQYRSNHAWTYITGGSQSMQTTGNQFIRHILVGGYKEVIV